MESKVLYKIYSAKSPSGKIYVGYTSRFERRKKEHIWDSLKGSDLAFHRALKKYGAASFSWGLLDGAKSKKEALEKEKYWIKSLNTTNSRIGYNESFGGEGFPGTAKIKKKISKTLKEQYHGSKEVRKKHSRERGGTEVNVYRAILQTPAIGFSIKRKALVKKGYFIGKFDTQIECCEILGLEKSKVCLCLKGVRKTHKGYIFEKVKRTL